MLIPSIIFIIMIFMLCGLKKVNEKERLIVFTLWKYTTILEPGLRYSWPIFQTTQKLNFDNTISETTAELEKYDIPREIKEKILSELQEFKNKSTKYYTNESVKKD